MPRQDKVSAAQKFFQRLAEDSVPTFECSQLLRSGPQLGEKSGDAGEGFDHFADGDGDAGEVKDAVISEAFGREVIPLVKA